MRDGDSAEPRALEAAALEHAEPASSRSELDAVDALLFPERVLTLLQPASASEFAACDLALGCCLRLQDLCPGKCFVEIGDRMGPMPGVGSPGAWRVNATVRSLLALGLDPDGSLIYLQSDVPQAYELMWTLACLLQPGSLQLGSLQLGSLHQGSALDRKSRSLGSFLQPLLQAAGILCVSATRVVAAGELAQPVALARTLARRINARTAVAVLPEPELLSSDSELFSARDAASMRLSPSFAISIFEDDRALEAQLDRLASLPVPEAESGAHDAAPVLRVLAGVAPEAAHDVRIALARGKLEAEALKPLVAAVLREHFQEQRLRYQELAGQTAWIGEMLGDAAARARREARETILRVREVLRD